MRMRSSLGIIGHAPALLSFSQHKTLFSSAWAHMGEVAWLRSLHSLCSACRTQAVLGQGSGHAPLFTPARLTKLRLSDDLSASAAVLSVFAFQPCLPVQLGCLRNAVALFDASCLHPAEDCCDRSRLGTGIPAARGHLQPQWSALLPGADSFDTHSHGFQFFKLDFRFLFQHRPLLGSNHPIHHSRQEPRVCFSSGTQRIYGVHIGVVDLSCLYWLCYDGCTKTKEITL